MSGGCCSISFLSLSGVGLSHHAFADACTLVVMTVTAFALDPEFDASSQDQGECRLHKATHLMSVMYLGYAIVLQWRCRKYLSVPIEGCSLDRGYGCLIWKVSDRRSHGRRLNGDLSNMASHRDVWKSRVNTWCLVTSLSTHKGHVAGHP